MPDMFKSVRSVVTLMLTASFCWLVVTGKIDPKDVMIVMLLVYNFYFLIKKRKGEENIPNV